MAYTKSGWYTNTILAALEATAQTGTGGLNLTLATWKISLLTYAGPTDGSSPVQFQTTTQAWVNTNEATSSVSNWPTTGVLLSAAAASSTSVVPTVTLGGSSPYLVQYSWTNPLSVGPVTIASVGGCIIYADPLTSPIVKPMVLSICFGATYAPNAGSFGITPSGSGLSQLTLTQ
jgi:hypothetical protein